ncbi:MAG TPA: hypothetical protein VGL58_03455 [Caulobacteraceae bacterium]|jgi:GNAT superfamily N-acetyltransferase
MGHAETIARDLGHTLVWLYTNQRFDENIRLYQRLGYAIDRTETFETGVTRVYMSKRLTP